MKNKLALLLIITLSLGCIPDSLKKVQSEAGKKFGDQHFKTVVSLIELHKVRNGDYPDALEQIQFMGDWDQMALQSVRYSKLDSGGYELDLTNDRFGGKNDIELPVEFWKGLGLRKSNLKH